MMPVIRVDEEVMNWLRSHGIAFQDTPNSVLRRLAGLGMRKPRARAGHLQDRRVATYRVSKQPDDQPRWFFQLYLTKLNRLAAGNEDFSVVVVCNAGAADQKTFRLPYRYLRDHVLGKAHMEPDGRYLFDVEKKSLQFVFRGGVRFDGKKFLIP